MNKALKTGLTFVITLCLGAGVGVLAAKLTGTHGHSRHTPGEFLVVLMSSLGVFHLVITLHEGGHYLAGRLVGFRAQMFAAGFFRWQRDLGWRWNSDVKTFGGLCMMVPTDWQNLVQRFARVIIGGPVASVLGAMLALIVSLVLPKEATDFRSLCEFFGVMSAAIALVTLLPIQNGAFLNDGKRLLRLRKGGPMAQRDADSLQLLACIYQGLPPREWPDELFASLELQDGSIFEGSLNYLAYMKALDSNDIDGAEAFLTRAGVTMSGMGKTLDAVVQAESEWFFAWYRGVVATELKLRIDSLVGVPSVKYRLEAARYWNDGQRDQALVVIESGLRKLSGVKEDVFACSQLEKMRRAMLEVAPEVTSP